MVLTRWLVDKSALWKLPQSPDYELWLSRIDRGLVLVSLPTRLEVAVSTRDPEHWPTLKTQMLAPLLEISATLRSESVALAIMDTLVDARLHRAVPLPDVMIASIAVAERLTVLHDDRDFERIRKTYGSPDNERLRLR